MGQIANPAPPPSIILTSVDRLIASNADGGLSPLAAHIILFGENAGQNLGDLDGIIAMGGFALDAGLADADLHGTIVIGLNAMTALTSGTNNDTPNSGLVVIGENAGRVLVSCGDSVIIGAGALTNYIGDATAVGLARSVIIGNSAMERLSGTSQCLENTIVGWRSGRGNINYLPASFSQNVFVGDQIASAAVSSVIGNTVVGAGACLQLGSGGIGNANQNVVMGQGSGAGLDFGDENVLLGANVGLPNGAAGGQSANTIAGFQANAFGSNNVILGKFATNNPLQSGGPNDLCIVIGRGAGLTWPATRSNFAVLETFDPVGAVQRSCLFADMESGAVILGRSTEGVDRQTVNTGTNTVKILNGAAGTAAPVGGGRLFALAGQLNWLASSGIPYQLTGTYTFATLPAGTAGARAFVSDALAPAFGVAVAGGGAVFVPVFHNGVAWIVG